MATTGTASTLYSTDPTWRAWVNTIATRTSYTGTALTDTTWAIWNGTACHHVTAAQGNSITITTSATDSVWRVWADQARQVAMEMVGRWRIEHVYTPPPPPTPEQRAERARIEEAARVARAQEDEKRKAARARARGLLISNLTREQRESYEKNGFFDVVVDGKTYRINQGTHGNVCQVDGRGTVERYCVQPDGVPVEDAMLAQLLTLRFAPQEFFRNANVTRMRN